MIDPAFQALLADPRNTLRRPPAHVSIDRVREASRLRMQGDQGPALARVENCVVGVPVRIYFPEGAPADRAILFFHGGGFVMCDLDTHDGHCRALARSSGHMVVAFDYRRAPEHPYPAAVEDGCGVMDWLIETRGIAPGRIAVAGDSAGAHIGLTTVLRARKPIAHLSLIYPIVDPQCDSASAVALGEDYILTLDAIRWFWECYLGEQPDPLAGADLVGLPPTTVVTAGFDPLRDEGVALAARLRDAGVVVVEHDYPGMIHGFVGMPHLTPLANEAIDAVAAEIRKALA